MDINLMVVNVGNTRAAIGAFVAGELTEVARVALDDRAGLDAALSAAWAAVARSGGEIAGASVNPAGLEQVEHALRKLTPTAVKWVGSDLEFPRAVKTDVPRETGVDRILVSAAAHEQLEKACVVVDAGTAVTINCCNDAGDFLGGAIAPGLRMQLAALNERTAKLPKIEPAIPDGPLGTNTTQAILHGVIGGIRGLVRDRVEAFATQLGTWPELIATGGDAELLFADWELTHAVSPDLILYGIALAYAEHDIRHGT